MLNQNNTIKVPVFIVRAENLKKLDLNKKRVSKWTTKSVFDSAPFLFDDEDDEPNIGTPYYLDTSSCEGICLLCKVQVRTSLRQFGVLDGCNCVFCLPCIRHWRNRGNVSSSIRMSCPICKKVSSSIIPSYEAQGVKSF